jgi:hypothetical protein
MTTNFSDTTKMAKIALNLARDIFSNVQNKETCEYYDRNATTGELTKCRHFKCKKVLPAKDDKPAREIRLSCTLHNCPFVNGR